MGTGLARMATAGCCSEPGVGGVALAAARCRSRPRPHRSSRPGPLRSSMRFVVAGQEYAPVARLAAAWLSHAKIDG